MGGNLNGDYYEPERDSNRYATSRVKAQPQKRGGCPFISGIDVDPMSGTLLSKSQSAKLIFDV
jgi:hypothetical protein